jgi:hypothetical protein
MVKTTRLLLAGVALGALALGPQALARGGGGGGHGGGGHFGGGHFGGSALIGAPHLGGEYFGAAHYGGEHLGAAHFGPFAHGGPAGFGHGFERLHGTRHFDRNAFGDRLAWSRWGGGHYWDRGRHRWGGWYGPVFWPYLYGDVFSFALWSGAYGAPFRGSGPDPFLSSIYWSGRYYESNAQPAGPYDVYGTGAAPPIDVVAEEPTTAPYVTTTCSGLAPGVTGVPIDEIIAQAVMPTGDQIKALVDLGTAAARASEVLSASCPSQTPLTPLDRLDAVEKRLELMIQAVQIVRTPLGHFYALLSEEQKAQLSALGQPTRAPAAGSVALCDPRAASFANLPVERIERTLQPTAQQESAFEALKAASADAAVKLEASCPAMPPQTPVERIDAVQERLGAMVQAAKSVRPSLAAFYATLSDEQKARLNMPAAFASVHS